MYSIRRLIIGIVSATAVAATLTVPAAGPSAAPQVGGVRIGVTAAKTRVVVELDSGVDFQAFTLPDPYRVVIDLPEVTWSPSLRRAPHGGLVTGMRFGLFKPGASRVVLDAAGPVRIGKAFILPPGGGIKSYRLVIDVVKTTRTAFMRGYRQPTPPQDAARAEVRAPPDPAPRKRQRPPERPLIMIDPGHGGVDPGAMSRSGAWEKHIVLSFARELRRQLLATGKFRVAMTRESDVFVRLRDRIARARKAEADLFVSIHADSIPNPRVRGGSVYTLSERASDREAQALANRENKADVIAGVDLNDRSDDVVNILIDLAQRETMNESAVFARGLASELAKVRPMLRNTHRFAGFAVLKAPDIPSVLVELGYLSNRQDEKALRDPAARRRTAASMVLAIGEYFQRQQAYNRP